MTADTDPAPALLDLCIQAMQGGWGAPSGWRWVMDLPSYKQIRAECESATGRRTDPDTWIPDPGDQLFGIPVEVRDDGGVPHLESPHKARTERPFTGHDGP